MTDAPLPLTDAEFRAQFENAANGLIEASDGMMQTAAKVATPEAQAALMADAVKLANQYEVLPEVMGLYSALNSGNQQALQPAAKALLAKCMQEGHPLQQHVATLMPEVVHSLEAINHAIVSKTVEKLVGEHGMPEGPVRDLLTQLKAPLEQVTQHGIVIAQLAQGQDEAKLEAIAKEVFAKHFPAMQGHIATLEGLGVKLPENARAQLDAFAQKLVAETPSPAALPAGEGVLLSEADEAQLAANKALRDAKRALGQQETHEAIKANFRELIAPHIEGTGIEMPANLLPAEPVAALEGAATELPFGMENLAKAVVDKAQDGKPAAAITPEPIPEPVAPVVEPVSPVVVTPEPVVAAPESVIVPEPVKPVIEPPKPIVPEPVRPAASGGGYTPSYSGSSSYSSASSVEAAVEEGFFTNIGKAFENHGGKLAIGAVIAAVIGGLAMRHSHAQREEDRIAATQNTGFVR